MELFINIFFMVLGFLASIYVLIIAVLLFVKNVKKVHKRVAHCALSALLPVSVFELYLLVKSANSSNYLWLSLSILLLLFIISSSVLYLVGSMINNKKYKHDR
ncbi:hypothetical protein OF364_01540 [Mycoplasma enhydrae]|uniref:hypothetical protein n=1 Tax=Mycoplasma enhydrae TaxID=2499220 RepID=UPI0021E9A3E4|nr:hypothetical protein [Mycoplasma enhydrae]MCV3753495.1 hypothetical protein [Mycoplasma enhydrae]